MRSNLGTETSSDFAKRMIISRPDNFPVRSQ